MQSRAGYFTASQFQDTCLKLFKKNLHLGCSVFLCVKLLVSANVEDERIKSITNRYSYSKDILSMIMSMIDIVSVFAIDVFIDMDYF